MTDARHHINSALRSRHHGPRWARSCSRRDGLEETARQVADAAAACRPAGSPAAAPAGHPAARARAAARARCRCHCRGPASATGRSTPRGAAHPSRTGPRSRPSASRPRRPRRRPTGRGASQLATSHPTPRAELGLDRVDEPGAARRAVEQARAIDRLAGARLRAGDEPARVRRVARPRPGLAAGPGVDRRLDDALRPLEVGRPASPSCSRGRTRATAARPRSARSPASRRAGSSGRCCPSRRRRRAPARSVRRRREEAVRREVARVVRRAGLDRRRPPVAARARCAARASSAQIGFCVGSVLPARMSVTRKAACGETACVAARLRAPARRPCRRGPRISRIIRGGTWTPPLAIAPYAEVRSSGRTSTVPSAPASPACRNASRPPVKRSPSASAVLSATASLPTRSRARMAGMLSEYWSALRTRTGPRSSWSASRGAQSSRAVELGRDVEQEAARASARLRVEGGRVEDRLERRARLAGAVAGRVVLRRRTCGWPGRRGSSRRCRRRPGRRRSGSRARRARRCGGPCRAARVIQPRSRLGDLERVQQARRPALRGRLGDDRAAASQLSRRAAGPASRAS